ncbi:2-dehydropantoate 2-reductase [Clostridium chauvoei]|uniref:2-dehydropantoate 2-reductase n=2 Tax=Clostridium chauvoei TaxID=46867 RepID=S6FP06_9CLOT|nr:2-dehydropantoate 2-reductase [Clostridium chauvoei]ATD55730.1 2-dehydropantoate 2-reductase [Clostridium chauvoei]ATD56594.1 2-dehydropantoate 2-reductase [Clostridium chauvoei]MBX7280275.1 2-dehydropantoate 2-reductase [Clostridium chauvoei]MBX7282760.1 2-dehydropantoate 2-reductase [Clostridium chauvoei]MBX7285166.1 2-dehydropantoate 2-reductase [Clostridium chauvoei]
MKIAIAGAGAMGSRFGLMLHKAGNEVILIDKWTEHVNKIKEVGLKANFNGEDIVEQIPAFFPNELEGKVGSIDTVILFTKAMQLDDMLQSIKSILSKDTKVLCLLNGLGHEDTVKMYVSEENILLGNTMWTAGLTGPGEVKLFGNGEVELQNVYSSGKESGLEVVKVLSEAGLNAKYSENVKYSIWRKACVNGTLNGTCTILDSNIASFGASKAADEIVRTIINEFADVAEKEGIILDREEIVSHVKSTFDPNGVGKHYPSMHQDLIKNNRLTEIDYINGAVCRKGAKYNVSTPYCQFLTLLVHAKEEILTAK